MHFRLAHFVMRWMAEKNCGHFLQWSECTV